MTTSVEVIGDDLFTVAVEEYFATLWILDRTSASVGLMDADAARTQVPLLLDLARLHTARSAG